MGAFEALARLTGDASASCLGAFGGMPGRMVGQEAYLARRFPWVSNWEVLRSGLAHSRIAVLPAQLPGDTAAWRRLQDFGSRMVAGSGLNLEAEMNQLEADLREIFK